MALINCPNCGNTIFHKALVCPKCGYNFSQQQTAKHEIRNTSDVASSVGGTSVSENVWTKELHKDIKPSQAELDYERSVRSNTIIKSLIVGVIIFVGIIVLAEISSYEDTSSYEETIQENYTTTTNSEDIEPWMVGTWKGSSYVMDWNNNSVKLFVNLEIDKYGNATQYMQMQGGSLDAEQFTLKYDRSSEQLYNKDGGLRITIQVDSYNKKLSMPSSSGTLYLYKQ